VTAHPHSHAGQASGRDTAGHSHAHDPAHAHENASGAHTHVAPPEAQYLGPSNAGSVMLDIGGDIGALILETGPELLGAEIEISPVGQDGARTHIAIRERRGPGPTRYAGIYPSLREGDYTLWALDGSRAGTATVLGGQVARVDWS
jgi:hypothetical protein